MTAQLGDVLAGVAVGGAVNKQNGFIKELLPCVDPAECTGIACHAGGVLCAVDRTEDPSGNGKRLFAGKTHHTDSPTDGGGNGNNGISHRGFLLTE